MPIPLLRGILLPNQGVFRGYIAFFTIKKRIIGFCFLADLKGLALFNNFATACPRTQL